MAKAVVLSIDSLLQGQQMDKQETYTLENQVIYIQEYFRLGGIYTGQGYKGLGWNSGGRFNALEDMHYEFCIIVSDSFWELGLEADELHWLLCWYGLGYDRRIKNHDYKSIGVGSTPRRRHTQFPFRRSDRIKRFCQTYPFEMERRDIECLTVEMAKAIAEDISAKTKDIKETIDWECGYRETDYTHTNPISINGVCRWDTLGGVVDYENYIISPFKLTTYDWRRRVQLENKLGFSFAKLNLPIYDARTDYDLLTKHSSPTKTLKETRKKYYGNKYNDFGGDNDSKPKRKNRPTS